MSGDDAAEYRSLLALKKNKEVRQMEQTWMSRAEEQGFKKGKAVGLEKGKDLGFRKGKTEGKAEAVDRMRRMVLQRIERRFGAVPEPIEAKVRAISSIEALGRLLEKVPSLQSADDLLPRRNGRPKSTD